jgi:signal transduction histidine kinase
LVVGAVPKFPHWMQLLFIQYPIFLIAGLLTLPRPAGARGFTPRHAGNLGLMVCTLLIVLIIAVTEPITQSTSTLLSITPTLLQLAMYASACIVALYLLWGYRWQTAYWPLAWIVLGMSIHTATFVADVHSRIAGTYSTSAWFNATWICSFAMVACAAYEYAWSTAHRSHVALASLLQRERWLEAMLPAVMIVVMMGVGVGNAEWFSARVVYICAPVGLLFAVFLAMREAWIHREEDRLVAQLNDSHDRLLAANAELSRNEKQMRSFNTALEQRVTERTQELQSAYRELESFSYAVAHDIKAPLRAVNAFGALLIEEHGAKLDSQALSYVERMRRGALHMAQLVDDLLAYARMERLELRAQPTDVTALIDECIAEQRDEITKLNARVTATTTPLMLHADSAALAQTLRNLLQNALKFSHLAAPPQVAISTQLLPERIQIVVSDNGIGFDMQYHDRIFALFQRLHRPDQYAGTGIGLAIARKAIERMGGRLWAQSKPNEGATFYIELPLRAD